MEQGDSCWWDTSEYEFAFGCRQVGEPCRHCWAPRRAGTLLASHDAANYRGLTKRTSDGRYVWNGKVRALPPGDPLWTFPLTYPGAEHPKLGDGMPSLMTINLMGDTFFEGHPDALIDRGLSTVAASKQIGLQLTRRTQRMLEYFLALEAELSPEALQRWQSHLWLGFSAGHQEELNELSPPVLELARRGWTPFVSFAPLIGRIVCSDEFLRRIKWGIVSGECDTSHDRCRPMEVEWARSLLAQFREARVAFFMKRMAAHGYIPPDLLHRQFPKLRIDNDRWFVDAA
jgi:protein gp37